MLVWRPRTASGVSLGSMLMKRFCQVAFNCELPMFGDFGGVFPIVSNHISSACNFIASESSHVHPSIGRKILQETTRSLGFEKTCGKICRFFHGKILQIFHPGHAVLPLRPGPLRRGRRGRGSPAHRVGDAHPRYR